MNTSIKIYTDGTAFAADGTATCFLHAYSLLRYGNGEDRAAAVSELLRHPAGLHEMLQKDNFPDREAADLLLRAIKRQLRATATASRQSAESDNADKDTDADTAHLRAIRLLLRAYLKGDAHPIL